MMIYKCCYLTTDSAASTPHQKAAGVFDREGLNGERGNSLRASFKVAHIDGRMAESAENKQVLLSAALIFFKTDGK